MVLSKSGQSLIAAIPRDRVLTETDSPFVSAPKRPVGPRGVIDAARGLAKLWHMDQDEAAAVVLSNYLKLAATAEPTRSQTST
jgi:TatD DNase family protein